MIVLSIETCNAYDTFGCFIDANTCFDFFRPETEHFRLKSKADNQI